MHTATCIPQALGTHVPAGRHASAAQASSCPQQILARCRPRPLLEPPARSQGSMRTPGQPSQVRPPLLAGTCFHSQMAPEPHLHAPALAAEAAPHVLNNNGCSLNASQLCRPGWLKRGAPVKWQDGHPGQQPGRGEPSGLGLETCSSNPAERAWALLEPAAWRCRVADVACVACDCHGHPKCCACSGRLRVLRHAEAAQAGHQQPTSQAALCVRTASSCQGKLHGARLVRQLWQPLPGLPGLWRCGPRPCTGAVLPWQVLKISGHGRISCRQGHPMTGARPACLL